jgi:hypothetical protein
MADQAEQAGFFTQYCASPVLNALDIPSPRYVVVDMTRSSAANRAPIQAKTAGKPLGPLPKAE